MTDHKAFGERVRFYRKRRGLHQRELGELLNRTEDWVYRVESGRIPVNNVKMLMDLAEALRVHLEDLQGTPTLLDDQGDHKASVPAIRVALMQSRRLSGPLLDDREPPRLERLTFEVGQAWELYQGSGDLQVHDGARKSPGTPAVRVGVSPRGGLSPQAGRDELGLDGRGPR
ncbi:helix-turn-helix domain-containing protein [Streptoverticillium reticulum]|uniref:helix-turn-helix domain-containing protein n=1 Tax=Streptoverticillium reticulum TaxID=1433415 RepID=UPI0039BEF9F6